MADTKRKPTEATYQVLQHPLITEKTSRGGEHGQVTFVVAPNATKPDIKRAVETLYNVKVNGVNTCTTKGKVKRFRGGMGRRSDVKKAIVKLAEGQSIDVTAGV